MNLLFCINFMLKKTKDIFEIPKICNINFWIENAPPPPLELSRKLVRFGTATLPLEMLPYKHHATLLVDCFVEEI